MLDIVYSLQSATEDGVRLLCRIGDTSVTETYIVTEGGNRDRIGRFPGRDPVSGISL